MVVVSSVTLPMASSASQVPCRASGAAPNSQATPAACTSAPASSTSGLLALDGVASATAANAKGATMTKSIASVLQRRELLGVERGELAVDVEHHDAHDEHRGEEIEEHARLHHRRHEVGDEEAEHVDAVLEDEEPEHLVHRLLARDDEQEARPDRGERGRDEVGVRAAGRQ